MRRRSQQGDESPIVFGPGTVSGRVNDHDRPSELRVSFSNIEPGFDPLTVISLTESVEPAALTTTLVDGQT